MDGAVTSPRARRVRDRHGSVPSSTGLRQPRPVAPETGSPPEPKADATPLGVGRLPRRAFVGRQRELARLCAALDAALVGHGSLVLVAGEPGVGKTALCEQLALRARDHHVEVLWGRCHEEDGAPPYWPWAQVVRTYVNEREPGTLLSEMGQGAPDIAEVFAAVRERFPGLGAPPAAEPQQALFRLLDSVATFLKRASKSQPLVLVLDDLHWADRPTLLLLLFLARELRDARLLVLGTYRDVELGRQHPLPQTLGALTREQLSERIILGGLDEKAVGQLIELTAGVRPPDGFAAEVYRSTDGNPFFVNEVVRTLLVDGQCGRPDARGPWTVHVPREVREVIWRRLDSLSAECSQALSVAAVIGREFANEALESVCDVKGERLVEVLEEAVGARLLNEADGAAGRYSFSHALIRETLYEELSTARRARLHARIADALERLHGDRAEEHAEELAHHYGRAASVAGPDKLVRYEIMAGRNAVAGHAWERAAEHFGAALAARRSLAEDHESAELHLAMGAARLALLERNEALEHFRHAFEYWAGSGDGPRAVSVIEDIEDMTPFDSVRPGVDRSVYERALALVPSDSAEAGRVHRCIGAWDLRHGQIPPADEAFERALALALQHGDRLGELRARFARAVADHFSFRAERSRAAFPRVIELAGELGARQVGLTARWLLAYDCLFATAELETAQQHFEKVLGEARELRVGALLVNAYFGLGHCGMARGDWQAASEALEAGLALGADARLLTTSFNLHAIRGDIAEAQRFRVILDKGGDLHSESSRILLFSALAAHAWRTRSLEMAVWPEHVEGELLASIDSLRSMSLLYSREQPLAWLAILRGNRAAAERLYAAVAPHATLLSLQATLGALAASLGRLDDSVRHFESELAFCRRGYRPRYAESAFELARVLLQRDGPGDRKRACALFDESFALATDLGMKPLLQQILGANKGRRSRPSGLSQREAEVLRLVATGRTNVEIADALVISRHTVGRHLSNIFDKLAVRHRADAAAWAVRNRLVE